MASSNGDEGAPSHFAILGCFRSKSFQRSLFLLLAVAVMFDAFDDWKSGKEFLPMVTENGENFFQSSWSGLRQVTKQKNETILHSGHSQLTAVPGGNITTVGQSQVTSTTKQNQQQKQKQNQNQDLEQTAVPDGNITTVGHSDQSQVASTSKQNQQQKQNQNKDLEQNQNQNQKENKSQNKKQQQNQNKFPGKRTNTTSANSNQWVQSPRTVLLGSRGKKFGAKAGRSIEDMWLGGRDLDHNTYGGTPILTNPYTLGGKTGEDQCTPSAEWQTNYYPTCNAFHELDFLFDNNDPTEKRIEDDHFMELLGIGTSRDTWKVTKDDDVIVLKTLQKDRDFTSKVYQHQRVDAVSSERLTASPYVLDIFGFCGPHVLNELGKGLEVKNITMAEKIRYAQNLAAGMRDTHGIDGTNNPNMVHADLRHNNVMFSYDTGLLKLSDYNQGYFLGWNKKQNEQCGYKPSFSFWHDRFAAPEECYGGVQTEKTDIYHLGGMLFYLLTEYKPYTFNRADFVDREKVMSTGEKKWAFPELPPRFVKNNDPVVLTMIKAIEACLRFKAKDRATAREIFKMLDKTFKTYSEK